MPYFIGDISFNVPILNGSGCWCLSKEQILELERSNLGGIVSKTCTFLSSNGNKDPNYYYDKATNSHFNCKGLPNLGYEYYKNIHNSLETNKPYILSIGYTSNEELKNILIDYTLIAIKLKKQLLVELNVSCPNIKTQIPGYHIEILEDICVFIESMKREISILYSEFNEEKCNIIYGIKLPPYFELDMINKVACLFNKYDTLVKYIVVSNSIPNCLPIDENGKHVLSKIYGGMTGKINKHIALSNVYTFSKCLSKNITIVGCGGIENARDIQDYMNMGASFVQLASCFYDIEQNKLNISKINNVINDYISKNNCV